MTAPDRGSFTQFILAPQEPFSNRFSAVNWSLLLLVPRRGHGSLRGRMNPPQHLVRSTGTAMSTASSRDGRGPRLSVAAACTLAPSGNHRIRDTARV
jgi:hypothetical protein